MSILTDSGHHHEPNVCSPGSGTPIPAIRIPSHPQRIPGIWPPDMAGTKTHYGRRLVGFEKFGLLKRKRRRKFM